MPRKIVGQRGAAVADQAAAGVFCMKKDDRWKRDPIAFKLQQRAVPRTAPAGGGVGRPEIYAAGLRGPAHALPTISRPGETALNPGHGTAPVQLEGWRHADLSQLRAIVILRGQNGMRIVLVRHDVERDRDPG